RSGTARTPPRGGREVEKGAQVAALAGLEATRETKQLVHVGHAPIAGVEGAHVRVVAAPLERPLDQARDRARRRDAPLVLEALAEGAEQLAIAVIEPRAQLLEV